LHENNVPVTLLSAGIGDVIVLMLKSQGLYFSNIKICSNFAKYDSPDAGENAAVIGWLNEPIHSMNKSVRSIRDDTYIKSLRTRPNALLIGDSIGDISMCDGCDVDRVLRVGFLNDRKSAHNVFCADA
jgi:hypothetical protein